MTKAEFENLQPGDIVRHKIGERSFIVTANYGDHVIAVDTTQLANPEEWTLIQKATEPRAIESGKGKG